MKRCGRFCEAGHSRTKPYAVWSCCNEGIASGSPKLAVVSQERLSKPPFVLSGRSYAYRGLHGPAAPMPPLPRRGRALSVTRAVRECRRTRQIRNDGDAWCPYLTAIAL